MIERKCHQCGSRMPAIKINPDGLMALAWLVEVIPCDSCRLLNTKLRILVEEHHAAKSELAKEVALANERAKWSAE